MTASNELAAFYDGLVGREVGGRYTLDHFLKAGGSSGVFVGRDRQLNRRVAIKILYASNPMMVARFQREAAALSKLRHPNTLTVHDFGASADSSGSLYMVMEFLEGHSLKDLLATAGRLEPRRAVAVVSQACRSLGEAHGHGIVHRDVKPSNVCLIDCDGNPEFVKVLDFGVAKVLHGGEADADLTQMGRIIGTPRYMSPEQIAGGEIDGRADLYSAAVMLFELLAGRVPFDDANLASLLLLHLKSAPPTLAEVGVGGIPSGLEHAIRKALAKRPEDRQASLDEFRMEIEAAVGFGPGMASLAAFTRTELPGIVENGAAATNGSLAPLPPPVPDDSEPSALAAWRNGAYDEDDLVLAEPAEELDDLPPRGRQRADYEATQLLPSMSNGAARVASRDTMDLDLDTSAMRMESVSSSTTDTTEHGAHPTPAAAQPNWAGPGNRASTASATTGSKAATSGSKGRSRTPIYAALAAVLVGAVGAGVWFSKADTASTAEASATATASAAPKNGTTEAVPIRPPARVAAPAAETAVASPSVAPDAKAVPAVAPPASRVAPSLRPPASTETVWIYSREPGVELFVNTESRGTTPLALRSLADLDKDWRVVHGGRELSREAGWTYFEPRADSLGLRIDIDSAFGTAAEPSNRAEQPSGAVAPGPAGVAVPSSPKSDVEKPIRGPKPASTRATAKSGKAKSGKAKRPGKSASSGKGAGSSASETKSTATSGKASGKASNVLADYPAIATPKAAEPATPKSPGTTPRPVNVPLVDSPSSSKPAGAKPSGTKPANTKPENRSPKVDLLD